MKDRLLDFPDNAHYAQEPSPEVSVHATAVVSEQARLDSGVSIGPYSVVGPRVTLDRGVHVGAHAIIGGRTTIGESTRVFPHATLGTTPQDVKYEGEASELIVGPRNSIREYANIAVGTSQGGRTVIGADNLIMAFNHIAHDCCIEDGCVLANGVNLAGHVHVGRGAVLGGMTGVHQFCRIGTLAMVAGGSMVNQDIPPYCLAMGYGAGVVGVNYVGMQRAGLEKTAMEEVKRAFRLLYREGLTLENAVTRIEEELLDSEVKTAFGGFLRSSKRGITRQGEKTYVAFPHPNF